MAKGDTSASEDKVIEKVSAIERKLDELKATTRTSIWVKRLVLLVIAVVIIIQVWSVITIFTTLDKEAYARAAQEEFVALIPKIGKEAGNLAEKLAPVYQKALIKEFNEGMPEIAETFTKETETLVKEVGKFVNENLEAKFGSNLEKHLNFLSQDMPELKDEAKRQQIMKGIGDACHTISVRFATELFKPQIDTLYDLTTTIETNPIPDVYKKMKDADLIYHTTKKVGDLLLMKLVVLEDVFAEPVKAEAKAVKPAKPQEAAPAPAIMEKKAEPAKPETK